MPCICVRNEPCQYHSISDLALLVSLPAVRVRDDIVNVRLDRRPEIAAISMGILDIRFRAFVEIV
jgi:hypothetical protein